MYRCCHFFVSVILFIVIPATAASQAAGAAGKVGTDNAQAEQSTEQAGETRDLNSFALPDGASVTTWLQVLDSGDSATCYTITLDDGRSITRQTSYDIMLRDQQFDPLTGVPAVPPALDLNQRDDGGDDDSTLYLVQFVTQPLEVYRATVDDLGGKVHKYLPQHAYVVEMTPQTAEQVRELAFVRWVGLYQPAYRVEPFLRDNFEQPGVIPVDQRYNFVVTEPTLEVKQRLAAKINAIGGTVNRSDAGKLLLEATLTPQQVIEAAGWNQVLWIDRWSPYETDMDLAREIGGANFVEGVEGYSGEGVNGEVLDVGFNVNHIDFASSPLLQHPPGSVGNDSHGASTSGIIFGDGTGNPDARGLLPDGQGIVADTSAVDWENGTSRYLHTAQLLEEPYLAVIHSASVGSSQTPAYTSVSAEMDAMLFDLDLLHCQSQSNTGTQASRPQAWAKNIVSVGGIRHMNTLTIADDCWDCGPSSASIGPAADGRIKPDLCHFYDNIFTVTSGGASAYTTSFGGTSGATPIVAGHFGLLFQMWGDGLFNNPQPPDSSVFDNRCHMTTAKAMMINTASAYEFSGSSHDLTRVHQGWGMPDLQTLWQKRETLFVVDETDVISNLETMVYTVTVLPLQESARFTLTWADPPGLPGAGQHRVNDLTLRVTAPDGSVYWGNYRLMDGNWSVAGGEEDTINTVENVFVEDPEPGQWVVEVIASEINEDGHLETPAVDADFALVASGVEPIVPELVVLPGTLPAVVEPGEPTPIDVTILDGGSAYEPGTGMLHYRLDNSDGFATVPLTHVDGVEFQATLPAALCEQTPEFYFSAQSDAGETVTSPLQAPDTFFDTEVKQFVTEFHDDFETDTGWTVENSAGLTAGAWERGVPVGGGDRGDPPTDADGSGQCYLTENLDGDSDIDDGITWLISPTIDLSDGDATINYELWYTNNFGADPNNDLFKTYVSNDNGATWVLAETIGPQSSGGWMSRSFTISDFVDPNEQVRVRFEASDLNAGSVVEAGIDAFIVEREECVNPCTADIAGADGEVTTDDLLTLLGNWGTDGSGAAIAAPADIVDTADLLALLSSWGPCDQ